MNSNPLELTLTRQLATLDQDPEQLSEKLLWRFVNCVHKEMRQQDLSRKDLAERLGVTQGYITQVLNGSFSFSVRSIAKISHALECDVTIELAPRQERRCLGTAAGYRSVAKFSDSNGRIPPKFENTLCGIEIG